MAERDHIRLSISGMSCAGCVATVEEALRAVPGVGEANVNFAEHTAVVIGAVPPQTLLDAVQAAGYEAAEMRGEEDEAVKEAAEMLHYRRLLRKAVVAALVGIPLFIAGLIGVLPAMATQGGQWFWLAAGGMTALVMAYSGGHFFVGSWKAFKAHNANMDTLIAVGTGSAWIYSMTVALLPERVPSLAQHAYFEAAAVIIACITVYLQLM